jgi:hypothetical protein
MKIAVSWEKTTCSQKKFTRLSDKTLPMSSAKKSGGSLTEIVQISAIIHGIIFQTKTALYYVDRNSHM